MGMQKKKKKNYLYLTVMITHVIWKPILWPLASDRLVGLVVKASASRAEGPGLESRLTRDFLGVESYQWLKHWYSSGYPARCLAL